MSHLSVWDQTKGTTSNVLSSISTTASLLNRTVLTVDEFAQTAHAHARAYKEASLQQLAETAAGIKYVRVHAAKRAIALQIDAIEQEMASNPRLQLIMDKLDDSDFMPKTSV